MITRYGYDVFFTVSAVCAIIVILSIAFVNPPVIRWLVAGAAIVFFGLTVNFFRDPERTPPAGENFILSPADGKVLQIKDVVEGEFLKADAKLISVFMSPLNVHVNRNPVTGIVRHFRYVKGEYFAAFEDKASEKNEQTIIGMESASGPVLFKQIAGFVARRIVWTLHIGDSVKAGERFGMIKFGSRVDVYVPVNASVRVSVGQKTVAGETVLAEFR